MWKRILIGLAVSDVIYHWKIKTAVRLHLGMEVRRCA